MAENVGSIEINVDVDTRTMSNQIERAANRAARIYGREFSKTAGGELNSLFTSAGARLRTSAAREGELSGEGFADAMQKSVVDRVKRWDLDISKGVVFGDWKDAVSTFDDVDDAVKRITSRMEFLRKEGQLNEAQYKSSTDSLKKWVDEARRLTVEQQKQARAAKAESAAMKAVSKARDEERRVIEKLAKVIKDQQVKQRKLNEEEEKSFRTLGRLKGARNDFVNLIGVTATGMENLITNLAQGAVRIGTFVKNFNDLTEGMSGLQKAGFAASKGFSALSGSLGKITSGNAVTALASLLAAVYAFAGVSKLITSLAGGLSALTGAVVALAAAVGQGLVAALLTVGPMLGALATGVLAVTLAVKANQDAFKAAVKPLSDWANEAGKVASKALLPGITSAAKDLSDVLRDDLTPLLRKSASAVGDFAKDFAAALGSSDMKANLKTFQDTWPGILTNLGRIFTGAFKGISGVLAAISPQVEDITDKIAKAVENWGDWASSADGKNSISDWFDQAWESATKLWDILGNLAEGLGNIFGQGKETGDDFLSSLQDITQEFVNWTNDEEGRQQISDWFDDAKEVAGKLWDVLKQIGETFDDWDTSDTRKDFEDLLGAIQNVIHWLGEFVRFMSNVWDTLTFQPGNPIQDWWDDTITPWWENTALPWMEGFWDNFGPNQNWWSSIGNPLSDWWDNTVLPWWDDTAYPWITELGPNIAAGFQKGWDDAWNGLGGWWAETWRGLIQTVKDLFGIASPSTVFFAIGGDIIQGLIDGLAATWQNVVTWWNGTAVPWLASLPATVGAWFAQMWGTLTAPLGTAWAAVLAWWSGTAVPWFQGLPASVGAWFTQMWGQLTAGLSAGWAKVTAWWSGTAAPWFKSLPGKVAAWFSNMWGQFTSGIGAGWGKVTSWWSNTAVPWFKGLPGKVATWFSNMWGQFTSGIGAGWGKVTSWWSNTAVPWFKGLPDKVGGFFSDMWQKMVDAAKELPGKISAWWNGPSGWPRIKALISGVDWTGLGADAAEGIVNGITGTNIGTDIRNWLQSAVDNAKNFLDINSPSKLTMREIGMPMGEGIALGLERSQKVTDQAMGNLLDRAVSNANIPGGQGGNAGAGAGGFSNTNAPVSGGMVFHEGAIQVVTPTRDPVQVAQMTVDRLVRSTVG